MKKSEVQKLKEKSMQDLAVELRDAKEKMRALRFELAGGKVKNSAAVREVRRKIARINTFIKEKGTTKESVAVKPEK